MTDPQDPPRLLDASSGAPAGLRDALSAAERDVGTREQVARLAAALGPLLLPALPATPVVASSLSGAAKGGLAALALVIAGGGAWLVSTSQSASPSAPTPKPAAVSPAAPKAVAPAPLVPAPAPAIEPSEAPLAAPAARPVPEKTAAPAQLNEAELLEQARSALKSDPARALARANEHAARFPRGVLVQEREVIAINALRQLGRTAEADRRAAAFSKAFPGSAFQRKLKPSP